VVAELGAQYPEFRDRSVLVTGGGSGIGAAIVEGFAARAPRSRSSISPKTESHALVDRLSRDSLHPVRFHQATCATSAIRRAVEAIVAHSGPIGVLVNNAARDDRHDFDDVTPDYWDDNQATNLRHVFFTAQAVAPSMRAAGGGAIINMSSIAFMLNMPDFPAYSTAKAGMIGLTKSLAGKLGAGQHSRQLHPAGNDRHRTADEAVADRRRHCRHGRAPVHQKLLHADAIVGPCLFLASDGASAVTAQSLIVDGGIF
jgi:NAD(P)-dependent dehydrogenase (short-subunit alcohol dehydrogenase family)